MSETSKPSSSKSDSPVIYLGEPLPWPFIASSGARRSWWQRLKRRYSNKQKELDGLKR